MDAAAARLYDPRVATLELTGYELRDAAQAARLAAAQAGKDAAAQPNRRIAATFAADAERYTRLAETFERARLPQVPKTRPMPSAKQ
jgi:class 3 adenylate cyclase